MAQSQALVALDARCTRQMSVGMQRYARELAARLPRVLAAEGINAVTITDGENFGIAEQVQLPWALWRKRPNLIHHFSLYAPLTRVAPTIVTIHDLIHLQYPQYFKAHVQPYYQLIIRRLLAQAKCVITDDQRTVDELERRMGVDPGKVRVIALGVDERFLAPEFADEATARVRERPYVLYAGNHREHKNLITLFAAWAALPDDIPYDLVCTGNDDFDPTWPRRRPNGAQVCCVGELDDATLARVMHGASALVYPSLSEGFGLPMLEALAVGTPVIASADAVPGVLREACIVVCATDRQAWGTALQSLENSPTTTRVQRRAVAHAFTWDRCASETAACYRELLEELQSPS